MRKHIALGVIALGMGTSAFAAEEVSHTFVEAGYGYTDVQIPGESLTADGLVAGASFELPRNFVVMVDFRQRGYDEDLIGLEDETNISAGVGYIWMLSPSIDLTTAVSYESLKLEGGGDDIKESGFGLSLGMRAMVTDKFELNGAVKYTDMELDEADVSISGWSTSVGGRYYFTPKFSGGLNFVSDKLYAGLAQINVLAAIRYDFAGMF